MLKKVRQRYHYSIVLLKELVRTDFKLQYQNSVLGYMWSVLRPLFMFLILYLVFAVGLRVGKGIPHWPVALLLGLVLWEFFNEVTKQNLKAIVSKGGLIRKINFPKYIIILSNSLSAFIRLLINLVVVLIFVLFTGTPFGWSFLLIPVFIAEVYLFALGASFLLSALYVKSRDINFIWEILLRGGFFASGIMFPMSKIFDSSAIVGKVLLLNPIAQIIQDARHGLLPNDMQSASAMFGHDWYMFVPLGIILVMSVSGILYFRRRSANFAENI